MSLQLMAVVREMTESLHFLWEFVFPKKEERWVIEDFTLVIEYY